jgi:predicted ATPase/DNA-binding CsgD family transcriptional regulator/DNA-binding XRE family transcriptional regulator
MDTQRIVPCTTEAALNPDELRYRRQALHLSQAQLGRALGVTRNSVARWERGELPIRHPELVALALDRLGRDSAQQVSVASGRQVAARHNLPAELSSFVGRELELAKLSMELGQSRLVTVVGSGGVGKTRLVLRLASDIVGVFRNGVWFVELAALSDPLLIARSVAYVLGIREQPGRLLLASVADAIGDRQLLLVLDNCEHVMSACAELVEFLLQNCRGLRILATSRESLGLTGEVVWPLQPLAVPADANLSSERIEQCEAVQLFVDRARAVDAAFVLSEATLQSIGDICRQLDGIPLAIELAAALLQILNVSEVAARLDRRLEILTRGSRGAHERHQTLRSTINWSYELLTGPERRLLAQTSVFAGGWTLAAAEAVCRLADGAEPGDVSVLEVLSGLVSKSMVLRVTSATGESRYRLLETIRVFALERLQEDGDEQFLRRRHASYCAVAAAEWSAAAARGPNRAYWLDRLDEELPNLRAALLWILNEGAEECTRMRWATVLGPLGYLRDHYAEAYSWNVALGAVPRGDRPSPDRARALVATAIVACTGQVDFAMAEACCLEARPTLELSDKEWLIRALVNLAIAQATSGAYDDATASAEEALVWSRKVSDHLREAMALDTLSWIACARTDWETARRLAEASLEIAGTLGDTFRQSLNYRQLGDIALALHEVATARAHYESALACAIEVGHRQARIRALLGVGHALLADREHDRASGAFAEALALARQLGLRVDLAAGLEGLGCLAAARGNPERALHLVGAASALREAAGAPLSPGARWLLDPLLEPARKVLGRSAASEALEHGRGLRLETAFALASEWGPERSARTPDGLPGNLTRREHDVADLIGQGLTNRQIAERLVVTPRTVAAHVEHILAKLGFRSRLQIGLWAAAQTLSAN